jgi:hypothetical protein
MALPQVGDGEQLGDGNTNETLNVGRAGSTVQVAGTSGLVGFYGKAPVVRRPYSSAVHATSALATSTAFGATQLAAVQEIQNTLIGLGIYATA